MINNFALNLGIDTGLSLVNDVMSVISAPDNAAGAGSGGQGVFAQILSDSVAGQTGQTGQTTAVPAASVNNNFAAGNINNSNAADNSHTAVLPPANGGASGVANNTPSVSSPAPVPADNSSGDGTVSANRGNLSGSVGGNTQPLTGNIAAVKSSNNNSSAKSKNGKTKNNDGTAAGQPLFFAGNGSIILQPLSSDKTGKAGNGGTAAGANVTAAAGAKQDGKNSGQLSASAGDTASFGRLPLNVDGGTPVDTERSDNRSLPASLNQNANTAGKGTASSGNSSGETGLSATAGNIKNTDGKISDSASGQNNINQNILNASVSVKSQAVSNTNAVNTNIDTKTVNANISNTNAVNTNTKTVNANISNTNAAAAAANVKTLIKDAAVNALNLNVLNGEARQALSPADGKNIEALSAGVSKAGDTGSGLASSNLFGAAGSAVSPAGSSSASASEGNSGGFNLTGGGVSGLEDASSGETNGSAAINSVMFMLRKNIQSATITLNPASLGSVKINISLSSANSSLNPQNLPGVSSGSITVNMLAQNEAAKNILQSSSDSLQNALKNQGFTSINLNISTGSGYNNGNGNNGSESFKNPFAGINYSGRYSNGSPEQGTVSAGINNFSARNPNALVDYFV